MNDKDSNAATAEKAQHDPHCPWFLTLCTAPFVLQSTAFSGIIESSIASSTDSGINPRYYETNSSWVRSVN